MRIIFFGSGQFCFPIVKKIWEEFSLLGTVVTKAKPRGRGLRITIPEIAQWAQRVGIKMYMPEDPNSDTFIGDISRLKPDVFVLSSYGHILSGRLLAVPRLGGINIHPSLLPRYRGAAPIRRAIMAGEEKTGITVFFMDEKIDHGEIIFQKEMVIKPSDHYESVVARLSKLGVDVITDVLKSVESGNYKKVKQQEEQKIYASKIRKEEMIINWQNDTKKIINLIRALSPKPAARTVFRNEELKIIMALPGDKCVETGTIHIENKNVYVGTGDGCIMLKEIKPANRSVISGLDFINGFRVKEGEAIG